MSEDLNHEQLRTESVLRGLAPAAPAIDRDRLMFAAGRASAGDVQRRVWPWQAGMAAMMALFIGALVMRPAPIVVEKPVVVHAVEPAPGLTASPAQPVMLVKLVEAAPIGTEYLRIRNGVLSRGVDALAPTGGGNGGAGSKMKLEGTEALPAWQRASL